ncbi:MAG: sigma factor-like helix-turn-helix DNA-binding protein [Candidatus Paceibacterota bacterium]|jgi:RNA polymerase sigma factor (sigma-70 family)
MTTLFDPVYDPSQGGAVGDLEKSGFDITIVARMKHGALYNAIRKRGWTVGQAAEFLGLQKGVLYEVLAMKRLPPLVFSKHRASRKAVARKAGILEEKLMKLTGQTIDELFPEEVRSELFLGRARLIVIDRKVSPSQLLELAQGHFAHQLEAPPSPAEEATNNEKWEIVSAFIKKHFDWRSAQMFQLYYFGDVTMAEIGQKFGVTGSNVGAILRRVERKLKTHPELSEIRGESSQIGETSDLLEWAKNNRKRISWLAKRKRF